MVVTDKRQRSSSHVGWRQHPAASDRLWSLEFQVVSVQEAQAVVDLEYRFALGCSYTMMSLAELDIRPTDLPLFAHSGWLYARHAMYLYNQASARPPLTAPRASLLGCLSSSSPESLKQVGQAKILETHGTRHGVNPGPSALAVHGVRPRAREIRYFPCLAFHLKPSTPSFPSTRENFPCVALFQARRRCTVQV
ncbi:hypothetical protein GE09DRAFT_378436 [Coniochaeta sp. 2T2.1]|nr:hypothetical protein GE09DRAFT_378436 [Coniochaeta sp. 2T2.1]